MSKDDGGAIIPARLAFLAIYNPSLGNTDETFRDQVVFYHSREVHGRRKREAEQDRVPNISQEAENEQLRQIGLAQGMVNFAQNFANGANLGTVETEKSRIILHEIEPGWWILASIDSTRIPLPATSAKTNSSSVGTQDVHWEYSLRDVSPATLLTQQIKQAHHVFKLHNGSSLDNILARNDRAKFCALLDRFWTRFAVHWNITLHGVPAVDVFGGMRLSAGGELGVGLGEEQYGCSEREVLEDFASRTEGLADLLVCRFGDVDKAEKHTGSDPKAQAAPLEPWLGMGCSPSASDGVVFSGVGTVARSVMCDLSHWIQLIYTNGENAYAVKESSSSAGRRRRHKDKRESTSRKNSQTGVESGSSADPPVGIPRSIVSAAEKSLQSATQKVSHKNPVQQPQSTALPSEPAIVQEETWKKVLKLGYGSSWGITEIKSVESELPVDKFIGRFKAQIQRENTGYFLIGLQGDLVDVQNESLDMNLGEPDDANQRIMIRTVHVHSQASEMATRHRRASNQSQISIPSTIASTSVVSSTNTTSRGSNRLRILVYVHRPFIYALLFNTDASSLMMPTFYRDLHTFLQPLHPLLLRRTGPTVGAARRREAISDSRDSASHKDSNPSPEEDVRNTWEIIHDSATLATIANMPSVDEESSVISRGDALNLHSAALEVLSSIQKHEMERRVKTGRGWWVGWARVPLASEPDRSRDGPQDSKGESASSQDVSSRGSDLTATQTGGATMSRDQCRQILLFRRATDADTKSRTRVVSGWGLSAGGSSSMANPRLAATDMSIGFDARRYVEGIMGMGK